MSAARATVPNEVASDVETLWRYHQLGHELRPVDVAIGLGSHDPGVAVHAADLYHQGLFPIIIFTGANAPTTIERFPRGEAVHYREIALDRGVPESAILIETQATNTAENITFTHKLVSDIGLHPHSAVLISRPYQQRRAYATSRKLWPELDVIGSAQSLPLDQYVAAIGDSDRVINMLIGDTQRIRLFAEHGFAIPQEIPDDVDAAFHRLVSAGYTDRLL